MLHIYAVKNELLVPCIRKEKFHTYQWQNKPKSAILTVFHYCHFLLLRNHSDRFHGLSWAILSPPISAGASQYQLFDRVYRDQSAAPQSCHYSVAKTPGWDSVAFVPGNTIHHKSFPICLQSFSSFSL